MEFSFLPEQLRDQFAEIYRREFHSEPNFNVMSAVVGVEDGVIKSFICIYATPIVDSLWVSPDFIGSGLWKKLLGKVRSLPWARSPLFIGISKREKAAGKRYGEELDWKVYR